MHLSAAILLCRGGCCQLTEETFGGTGRRQTLDIFDEGPTENRQFRGVC